MSQFISWINYKGRLYFLTKKELATRDGKALIKSLGKSWQIEIVGHGAIRAYYGFEPDWGTDHECTDFSSSKNFPHEIVTALKEKLFMGVGFSIDMLTWRARIKFKKATQLARAKYEKVAEPAWAEYEKVAEPAWAKYEKVKQLAWNEYEKVERLAWTNHGGVDWPAWVKYEKIKQLAWNEYEKVERPAWAKHERIMQPVWVEYEKVKQITFWKLFSNPKNRTKTWG